MTREMKLGRAAPKSGTVKSAVIFLHGYGADGDDLLGLAEPLGEHLPDTLFLAPDAPEECITNPFGRQWFPIPWLDESSPEDAAAGLAQSSKDLNAFLDKVMEDEGLTASQIVVFGFSQGTMMALQVIPRRAEAFAGIIGFSGRLLRPDALAEEVLTKPPVLLAHGNTDQIVPFSDLQKTAEALQEAGFQVYAHVMEGTGHGISPGGLGTALSFLSEYLPS
ncbi:phospholipase/carboxylesterase [Rhodobacter aestuarii]|uniref:Phospholipase/carboxylesterase n=1 Tax=Rhodobacter aestuarii TaxID=453582 RepID=A0A1N7MRK0_9RHOB|nr:dienelactone hydrolase family protein [Rhodobacter aestuarii]PTV96582.1 phospholipase/carboxylesterase [Rhodobacter aestuarii]SIS88765.1 phospholipase/carboxylesterase [Rhodobacter aestuarii]